MRIRRGNQGFSAPSFGQLLLATPERLVHFDDTLLCNRFPLLPGFMVSGIVNGMELRIDKAGRIVVPKPLRERLGFKPDTELEAIEQPEGVLLKRVEQRPSMVKVDGLWVHQGSAEPGANWERVLEDVREERIESVLKA
jgi:AbrB family looped-hinge helix DNA binding protein